MRTTFCSSLNLRAVDDRLEVGGEGAGGAGDDLPLVLALRVIDFHEENEAVLLRLGQRIGALLLDRVLRREDEERLLELQRVAADGDAVLLHRLEQRGLRLRRRAVDFIREEHLGEDRAFLENETAVPGRRVFLDDVRAGDVRGHQVGRELDAAERQIHGARERANHRRLREAGHAFEQAVAAGEHGDDELLDDLLLADDELAHLLGDPLRRHRRGARRRLDRRCGSCAAGRSGVAGGLGGHGWWWKDAVVKMETPFGKECGERRRNGSACGTRAGRLTASGRTRRAERLPASATATARRLRLPPGGCAGSHFSAADRPSSLRTAGELADEILASVRGDRLRRRNCVIWLETRATFAAGPLRHATRPW